MSDQDKKGPDWCASLKPGDEVAICGGGWKTTYRLAKVERLTATQIVLDDRGRRFRKSSGVQVGKSFSPRLEPVTDELRKKIEASSNRERFSLLTYRSEKLTDEQIAAMLAGYDAVTPQEVQS